MKCPYCATGIHLDYKENVFPHPDDILDDEIEIGYAINYAFCPECHKLVISLQKGPLAVCAHEYYLDSVIEDILIYPKTIGACKLDESIPTAYRDLYREAELVNSISPRSSATLSRYLLQMILHEELGIVKRNLEEEIKELEERELVSVTLAKMLQVFRKIANFGAHPKKSTNSNEIVEIAKGEAEIMLDLLRELFDCLFVKPQQQKMFLESIKEKYGVEM